MLLGSFSISQGSLYWPKVYMLKVFSDNFSIQPSQGSVASGHTGDESIRKGCEGSVEVNFVAFLSQLKEIYLIQIDTLFIDNSLQQEIQAILQKENASAIVSVLCVASHSHSLPGIDLNKPLLGKINDDYRNFIKSKIVKNIISSSARNLAKHVIYSKINEYSQLTIGRRGRYSGGNFSLFGLRNAVPDFKKIGANLEVTCLKDSKTQKILSVIWAFPAHPVLYPGQEKFSSDFPGLVRDLIRKRLKTPSLTILYLPGCTGDMKSFIKSQTKKTLLDYIVGQPFANCDLNEYKNYCNSLESELFDCIKKSKISKTNLLNSIKHQEIKIPLDEIGINNNNNNNLRIDLLSFNNINRFALMNCEPANNYSNLLGNNCTVSGYAHGVFGYLPTDEQIQQGGYEVDGFMRYFGTTGSFFKNTEKIVLRSIEDEHITD